MDPMTGSEPLYPPVPNKWLIDHQLDYSDMNILERDPKHKGFTILEEYMAGTDPNNPCQFPPLHLKLQYSDGDIRKKTYLLEFLGEEENEGRKEYQLRPLQPLPNPEKKGREDTSARVVSMGDTIPGAPLLKVVDYHEKMTTLNETEFDISELVLENTLTGERYLLRTKRNHPRDYAPIPISMIESVSFHYNLSGAPEETISVERGKNFVLASLDKGYSESYKLVDFSKDGILLKKEGKTYTVKPGRQAIALPSSFSNSQSPSSP